MTEPIPADAWLRQRVLGSDEAVEGYLVARAARYGLTEENASAWIESLRGTVAREGVQNRLDDAVTVVEARVGAEVARMRQLIADLVDADPCWFDHHGGCQAHGYLSLKRGELCPHEEGKQLLAASETGASS